MGDDEGVLSEAQSQLDTGKDRLQPTLITADHSVWGTRDFQGGMVVAEGCGTPNVVF